MQSRLVVIVGALAMLASACFVTQSRPKTYESRASEEDWLALSRFSFRMNGDDHPDTDPDLTAETIRSYGKKERDEYIESYSLKEIASRVPLRAGMTLSEMAAVFARQERQYDQINTLSLVDHKISEGRGWAYAWGNGELQFHCDIVVESGKVQSVWIMPGNLSWMTGIYYRISGQGRHKTFDRFKKPWKMSNSPDILFPTPGE